MHSEMGPGRQNPIQRTVRIAHLSVLMTQLQYTIQHRTVLIISPLTWRDWLTAKMEYSHQIYNRIFTGGWFPV